ncbi:MAG: putative transporter, major facilitator superfamily [Chloroflexota bacterium]|nr:putative transporter, major facilitator superfamily [Chloroflexota bacterium]
MSTLDERDVRRARVAVSALFLVNGALMANVLPRLPAIKAQLELTNAALGTAVAAMPLGGLIAGAAAGLLIVRYSSRRVTVATGVAYGLLLVSIGLAPDWVALAAAFLVLGMLDAVMDSAMNAHGIVVQRGYGRSVMHGFHGWWSAGTLLGAGMGAFAAALDVPLVLHLAVVGIVLAGVSVAAMPFLLRGRDVDAAEAGEARASAAGDPGSGSALRALRLLGLLAPFALIGVLGVMLEDAAQTWSTIYLTDVLGAGVGVAALAVVLYTAGMTAGRLTNDRWIDRWGDTTVARSGALVATAGLAIVIASGPWAAVPLAAAGFALVGLGTAPLFPVMITAAGSVPGVPSGQGVAIVAWLARAGFVIAPTLVGVAADRVGLSAALGIPLVAGVAVAVLMGTLLGASGRRTLPAGREVMLDA